MRARHLILLCFSTASLIFSVAKVQALEVVAKNGSAIEHSSQGGFSIREPKLPPLGESGTFIPNETLYSTNVTSETHLVLKLRDRRVYVYQGEKIQASYPVAIGKAGWETPTGTFEVFLMEKNPIFKSFKTGNIIEPGPDNPLGARWIGFWTNGKIQIGFHGTNEPELIGQAVSHGCVRMRNEDVIALYEQVGLGTKVTVKP